MRKFFLLAIVAISLASCGSNAVVDPTTDSTAVKADSTKVDTVKHVTDSTSMKMKM